MATRRLSGTVPHTPDDIITPGNWDISSVGDLTDLAAFDGVDIRASTAADSPDTTAITPANSPGPIPRTPGVEPG